LYYTPQDKKNRPVEMSAAVEGYVCIPLIINGICHTPQIRPIKAAPIILLYLNNSFCKNPRQPYSSPKYKARLPL